MSHLMQLLWWKTMQINNFFKNNQRRLTIIGFCIIFVCSFIYNTPTWVLAHLINTYSQQKLKLYNSHGTFWNGSGLIVIDNGKRQQSSPLLMLNWHISFGFKRIIEAKFAVGNNQIADLYLNTHGLNLDNLKLSLSIRQLSHILDIINDLDLSGNIALSASHVMLGKQNIGSFKVILSDVSSGLSPSNPLGTYNVNLDLGSGAIKVATTDMGSTLILNGTGNLNSLTLNAKINEAKREKMAQFITVMGIPQPDNSYMFKIF